MPTPNPYTDLGVVAKAADAIVLEFRRRHGEPGDQLPEGMDRASEGERDRARTAANVSDAADAILALSGNHTRMDTLARTAASTLGRILAGLER